MKKLAQKLICKNIIKILEIYKNSIVHKEHIFKDYLDQTIYFELDYLIKIVKERK